MKKIYIAVIAVLLVALTLVSLSTIQNNVTWEIIGVGNEPNRVYHWVEKG